MSGRYAAVRDCILAFLTDTPAGDEFAFIDAAGMNPAPQSGWIWSNENRTFSAPPNPVLPVPVSVTPAQARIALSRAGLLDTVNTAIAALTGPDGLEVQIWWEKAEEIRRDNPHLGSIAAQLGLSSDQVDDLFRTAATIS